MKPKTLTEGSIFSHMLSLSLPLMLGNLLQQFYNTIDAFVLGRFTGTEAFAAIGIASSIMNLFLFAVTGACTGLSVLFSQFYGAREMGRFRQEHYLTLCAGLPLSMGLGGIGILCLPKLLAVIQTPASLTAPVKDYLILVLAALPASYLYNLYSALLRSIGRADVSLVALAGAVGVNLFLDILLVSHGYGIFGAALSTAIAQVFSFLLCLGYLRWKQPETVFRRSDRKLDRALLKKSGRFAFVAGLHQSSLYIGKLIVQGAVNTGGTELITAYTATTRLEGFANSFGDSGAAATSVITAQNLGAQKYDRVQKTFRVSLWFLLLLGLFCSVVMYTTSNLAVSFLMETDDGNALHSAQQYMRWIALFYPLCFTGNTFAGYFDGCGKVSIPFCGAVTHISLRAILSWIFVGRYGLNAVAIATGIGWVLVNLIWTICYFRQKETLSSQVSPTLPGERPGSCGSSN